MSDAASAGLRLLSRIQRLEALPRTGWIVSGVARPESISAHIYEVAVLSLFIADHVDEPVDVERVLRIALLHDVGEAITTDIPTPTKRLIGRDVVRRAEEQAARVVCSGAPEQWPDAIREYNDAESLESRIVKAADTVQMLARALAYQSTGQGDVRRFFRPDRSDYGLPIVRDMIDELATRFAADDWFVADLD